MTGYYLLCVVCALCVSWYHKLETNALAVPDVEDNCILSFVVPRDKIKSSCQSDEKINRHLNAVEMKVNQCKQQVSDMQAQLNKQRQLNSEKLETLERQVLALNARKDMNILLERRLTLLEKAFDESNTDVRLKAGETTLASERDSSVSLVSNSIDSDPSTLPNVVKSVIQVELSEFLSNFTKSVERYVQEQIFLYNKVFNILPRRREASPRYSEHSASPQIRTSAVKDGVQVEGSLDKLSIKDGALLETFEKVKVKLNYTGDQIAKHFGSYMKNITKVGYTEVNEKGQVVIANGQKKEDENLIASSEIIINDDSSEHKEPFSGENADANDTSLDDPFTSSTKDVSGRASSRISQNSKAHGNSTEPGLLDSYSHKKWKANLNREQYYHTIIEAEDRLKDEVTTMLHISLAEVLSLIEEQKVAMEAQITFQDVKCEQLNKDLREHREKVENDIRATNLQLETLSVELKNILPKADRIQPLETLVNEIKNNMTVNRTSSLIEHEEQSKRLKKLERLMGVFQHSMEHYRNETKHEYREMRDSLDKEANTLRTFSSSLQNNVTGTVSHEINKLNISHMARFREINDQIRTHEDALLSVQIHMEKAEKLLENRPKRSDRDLKDIQETINDISVKQRDMKKALERVEQAQTGMNGTMSIYFQEVSSLKTEVKLNHDEWLPLTFQFDSSRTECFGDQYVRRIRYSKTRLVGVVLCSPTRYKILLSTSLQNTFLNIGDGNGMGEDHCEFVGGKKDLQIKLSPFKPSFEAVQGYARNQWGQEPAVSYLNAIKPSPHWYECGVRIP